MHSIQKHLRNNSLRSDFLASWVVFVVAVPLCLGIALASGGPVSSGLISAIIGGIVAGLLAGAPLVVTGPAAGLTAIVFQYVQDYGWLTMTAIGCLAGLFQIAFGISRSGKWINKVPEPVVEGMMGGIGLIILTSQTFVLLGVQQKTNFLANLKALPEAIGNAQFAATTIGLLTLGAQLLLPRWKFYPKWIPAALPAVFLACIAGMFLDAPKVQMTPLLQAAQSHLGQLSLSFPQIYSTGQIWKLLSPAFALALVASTETLLTARGVDKLQRKAGYSTSGPKLDQELAAQGAANTLSSFLGGLPVTGVIIRSAVNVQAGGRTRWSAILHGVWFALFALFLPAVMETIPLAALASVLMLSGYRLLNVPFMLRQWKVDREDATLATLTLFAIAGTDMLRGLGIGLGVFGCFRLYERFIHEARRA